MSAAEVAIVDATLARLRLVVTNPVLTQLNCDWQPDGKPPPAAAAMYIAVDEDGTISKGDAAQGELQEVYRINVFVSVRSGQMPNDQRADIMRRASQPLTRMERQIVNAIHGSQVLRAAAVALLDAGDAIFTNPLYYAGRAKTEIKDSSWSSEGDNTDASGWVVRKLPFIGMRRTYYIGSVI